MHLLDADQHRRGGGAPARTAPAEASADDATVTEAAIARGDELSWEQLVEEARRRGPDPRLAALDDRQLVERICLDAAAITAAMCRWLELLGELVVRGLWADEGARTPGAWLSWKLGIGAATAREHVRIALRLRDLPAVRARFADGTLSYSKVRAISRVAVPASEELLLMWADHATAAQMDTIVRGLRTAQHAQHADGDAEVDHQYRESMRSHADGTATLTLRGPAEEIAALRDQLQVLAEALVADRLRGGDDETDAGAGGAGEVAGGGPPVPTTSALPADPAGKPAVLLADPAGATEDLPADPAGATDDLARVGAPPRRVSAADLVETLGHVVAAAVSSDVPLDTSGLDRTTYVVQVDAADLVAEDTVDGGPDLAPVRDAHGRVRAMDRRAIRRLACEAGLIGAVVERDGDPLDLGRRRRRTTAALRRAIHLRDRCCTFPGCHATRHLHVHHVLEWSQHGPTDRANLVLVCSFHHRFVHDRDVHIEVAADGRHRFTLVGADQPLPAVGRLPTGAPAEAVGDPRGAPAGAVGAPRGAPAEALDERRPQPAVDALAPPGADPAGRFDLDTAVAVLLGTYERTVSGTAAA